MTLLLADFPAWMQAVHGHSPFPWQERLLRVVRDGGWPTVLKLPTASGKTTALDVALFALALEALERPLRRRMPMRIVLVVDRRIVVDGAFDHAKRIRDALQSPSSPVVSAVAAALTALGGEYPLDVALLRGGIYREDRWARQPNQPIILCSTVDQVGSRLLHRGYGLSPKTWPIHAGLLGNDTLVLLDEAHCSEAFFQTLEQVAKLRGRETANLGLPFVVTAMTATPRHSNDTFELDDADAADPVLRRRLAAPRPMSLVIAKDKTDGAFTQAMRDAVTAQLYAGGTVLAVVNRVRAARDLFMALGKLPLGTRPELLLLTGRARPVERDDLVRQHASRIMAGRDREAFAGNPALVVVATQCVEVGADLDMDALVTEASPLDALRQRLGRLNRLGLLDTAPCTVVSRHELAWSGTAEAPIDPIYGPAVAHTWRWLSEEAAIAPLDGGVTALGARAAAYAEDLAAAPLSATVHDAPIIFPEYCDLWAQTGPAPALSPEPAVFLHGPQRGTPEVQVIWRADLDEARPEIWADTVALCVPVSSEALSLSLFVAKQWLDGSLKANTDDATDVEGLGDTTDEQPATSKKTGTAALLPRAFLCWRGRDQSLVSTDGNDIRPGDTLVVPAGYGGCDAFGWQPDSTAAVADLADAARIQAKRAPVLRLHPALCGAAVLLAVRENAEQPADLNNLIDEALHALGTWEGPLGDLARQLVDDTQHDVEPHPSGVGYVVTGRAGWAANARDFSDEDDSSSTAPRELSLVAHLGDVRDLVRTYAAAVGLSAQLVDDLALAAHLHDLGKADPRFQAWLRDGDAIVAARGEVLAKSPRMPASRWAAMRARERAGYPLGGRHELLSVRLAESCPALLQTAHDQELVLHLVESHHGHCRPFAPVVADERPLTVRVEHEGHALQAASLTALERLDSGVAERFFVLLRRYGWWGLSYLEACLRLADHRASERAAGEPR